MSAFTRISGTRRLHLGGVGLVLLVWICCGVETTTPVTDGNSPSNLATMAQQRRSPEMQSQDLRPSQDPASTNPSTSAIRIRPLLGNIKRALTRVNAVQAAQEPSPREEQKPIRSCSAATGTYRERAVFEATMLPNRWSLNRTSSQPGATLTSTKRGPAGNPALCKDGCAVLALTIPAGIGWGGGAIVDKWFTVPANLNGATIRARVALEISRPNLAANVRLFTQGDESTHYTWGTTASLATPTIAEVSTFHEITLRVKDRMGTPPFCASRTGAIGIQVQRSRTSSVDIPVKLFIRSVTVGDSSVYAADSTATECTTSVGYDPELGHVGAPRDDGNDGYCQLDGAGSLAIAPDDWVTAGTCQGYGYTYVTGKQVDTKIVPRCTASKCTPRLMSVSNRALCANGTIAADPTWMSKAGIGFDFDPKKSRTSGLSLSYQMTGTAILRFILEDAKGNYYCVDLDETSDSSSTLQIPWDMFSTHCWDRWNPGTAYNPAWPLRGIRLEASCLANKNAWFDMCIGSLATF